MCNIGALVRVRASACADAGRYPCRTGGELDAAQHCYDFAKHLGVVTENWLEVAVAGE